jgi:hypothetical protein
VELSGIRGSRKIMKTLFFLVPRVCGENGECGESVEREWRERTRERENDESKIIILDNHI